ncbi:hypothetical protein TruAng_001871 [Truncatella angustata]|nr:hypothetical protein TruAng_001871 [Truncatella angustata]
MFAQNWRRERLPPEAVFVAAPDILHGILVANTLIKTLLLAGSLPECEEKCCPWGYGCDSAQNCGIGLNDTAVRAAISLEASRTGTEITPSGTPTQSAKASATAPTGITTPILSSDVPARSSSTSALTSNSSAAEASSPVTAETKAMIAAAVLGGLLAILLVMASIFILRRKHGRKLKTKRASQRQFMKAELDADGELRPRHAFHMLSSDRGPAELPATLLKSHMATPVCAELEARDAAGEGKSWRRETCRVHKGT